MAKENVNHFRHKWENRMVAFAVLLPIIAIVVIFFMNQAGTEIPQWVMLLLIPVVSSPIITPLVLHYNYWKEVADAVEVSDQQFPELYRIFKEQVERANLGFMPRLYVKNGNGKINAFAAKSGLDIKKHGFIVLYSDAVDAFYDLGNENTIRFIMSHEIGHLKLGHVHIRRTILKGVLKPLYLTNTLVRAQEYSADRFGASITDRIALPSLAILVAGKRNYEKMNMDVYFNNDAKQISWLWIAIPNFMANHPIGRRRLEAAGRMDKEGWENVHGKML